MRRFALSLALLLCTAVGLDAQDFTGSYIYRAPEGGDVLLELRHNGNRVSGAMKGLDGSMNHLEGTLEDGQVSGSMRTRNNTVWFAAGMNGPGLTLVIAVLDPETGQPDLDSGWQLEFVRAAAEGAGVGAGTGASLPSAGSGAASGAQAPQATPLTREWMAHLSGKKISYIDSYASGGSGLSDRWEAYLCSDGTFHFRSSSSMSADAGSVFGNSNSSGSFRGAWRIVEQNGQALLQYQRAEQAGTDQGEWVALGYQDGSTYFDGARVYVTNDNTVCR